LDLTNLTKGRCTDVEIHRSKYRKCRTDAYNETRLTNEHYGGDNSTCINCICNTRRVGSLKLGGISTSEDTTEKREYHTENTLKKSRLKKYINIQLPTVTKCAIARHLTPLARLLKKIPQRAVGHTNIVPQIPPPISELESFKGLTEIFFMSQTRSVVARLEVAIIIWRFLYKSVVWIRVSQGFGVKKFFGIKY